MNRAHQGRHRKRDQDHSHDADGTPSGAAATKRQALSVGIATGAYGISFGALSVAAGLSVWQTIALSLLMFTGGSQFAFVGIIGAGGGGLSATATASLLGVRNGLYALEISRLLDLRGWRRLLGAHWTIDESTAVAVGQPDTARSSIGFWWTGAAVFVLWNLTTAIGAVLGDAMGDPRQYGLDAAAAAAFCALLWPRLHSHLTRGVALVALLLAVGLSAFVPPGVPVLLAALVALVGLPTPSRGAPADSGEADAAPTPMGDTDPVDAATTDTTDTTAAPEAKEGRDR
ncbi:putative branched-subunit amino acid permease [Kineosphaera limosa]|uniref:Putative AzlC family protein n=1 Tax=Kineosphaera limosa NBRC 100340 TaxID=1184609 RepID=K6WKD6_9MICO|nr:AzlC family ABC transporter permease [Kineosphaera limosa]NYE02826.1 putative branched-subunit amino acid permease [Kineosphaera limosa]GAB94256.1 putative AzlC family protein [Kineosphaera limosa NBRC 100340]